jgi:hypothetical protein
MHWRIIGAFGAMVICHRCPKRVDFKPRSRTTGLKNIEYFYIHVIAKAFSTTLCGELLITVVVVEISKNGRNMNRKSLYGLTPKLTEKVDVSFKSPPDHTRRVRACARDNSLREGTAAPHRFLAATFTLTAIYSRPGRSLPQRIDSSALLSRTRWLITSCRL